jgi:hypothetical protein
LSGLDLAQEHPLYTAEPELRESFRGHLKQSQINTIITFLASPVMGAFKGIRLMYGGALSHILHADGG